MSPELGFFCHLFIANDFAKRQMLKSKFATSFFFWQSEKITYTGTTSAAAPIASHSLGSAPGFSCS